MRTPRKPLPILDHDNKPFWDGCARGELLLQRCGDCGAYRHPPRPICDHCLSAKADWVASSGEGTVYSFVVVHRAFHPAWEEEVPYVVAIVELAEGPHVMTNIVDTPPETVTVGMPVRVTFDKVTDEISLPKFRPR